MIVSLTPCLSCFASKNEQNYFEDVNHDVAENTKIMKGSDCLPNFIYVIS